MTRLMGNKRRAVFAAAGALALAGAVLCAFLLPKASAALPQPSETLIAASQGLDQIQIEAVFLPDSRTLTVRQILWLTSRADETRNELVLRTWPNAYQSVDTSPSATEEAYDSAYPDGFSGGSLVMREAAADQGQGETPIRYRYTDAAKTVLALPLAQPWQTGETLTVRLSYTLNLPNARGSFGARNGVYAFGNALVLPAVWENGAYRTDPFDPIGDPFVTDTANIALELTAPQGYACAASAWPDSVGTGADPAMVVYHYSALAVRDFAFVLSNQYDLAQEMEGGVLVSAFAESPANAKLALRYLRSCLRVYSDLYGAYPYQSLTLAEVQLPYGGMEYPGFVMISADLLTAQGDQTALEYLIAHEAAHQWWYAVVGSDQYNQPWQDEALCEYSVLRYMETVHGRVMRDQLYELNVAPSLRVTMPRGVTPGAPLSYFSSMGQYQTLVYNRGAAMFCALDDMMDGGLDGFLRAYYARFAFQRASRQDFLYLLANYSGEDYDPLITDYLDTYIVP